LDDNINTGQIRNFSSVDLRANFCALTLHQQTKNISTSNVGPTKGDISCIALGSGNDSYYFDATHLADNYLDREAVAVNTQTSMQHLYVNDDNYLDLGSRSCSCRYPDDWNGDKPDLHCTTLSIPLQNTTNKHVFDGKQKWLSLDAAWH
jgi:hypothetical protein